HVFKLDDEDKDWIEAKLKSMSLHDKCAQMIMSWSKGFNDDTSSVEFKRISKLVRDSKIGGIIFFQGEIFHEKEMIDQLQDEADIPLLISSDFERGLGSRIGDAIEFPYNMAIGATGNIFDAYEMGREIASSSKAIGVRQNLAPVADVNNNPLNPIINIRSFSEDKEIVSSYTISFISGAKNERVITTAKHFPGHGNTQVDSHLDLPIISGSRSDLFQNELVPFIEANKAGVQSIMVGHLYVPALQGNDKVPSSLSKAIVTDLLQNELQFDGLILTDALNMNAVTKYFSVSDAAINAINAGNDILLMPPDDKLAINAIISAVRDRLLSIERINHTVRKILAAKRWLKLQDTKIAAQQINEIDSLQISNLRLAIEIAERSITLVKNDNNIIPLNLSPLAKVGCITFTDGEKTDRKEIFEKFVRNAFKKTTSCFINRKSTGRDYNTALSIIRSSDITVLPIFMRLRSKNDTLILAYHEKFIKEILKSKKPIVVISLYDPYLLSVLPSAKVYLCSFGDSEVSQQAAFDALTGEIDITGRLPISIPNTDYKLGDGITIMKRKNTISEQQH
ncbi:MAG TPA: glycoside hydrolase family 3 N-terminal domain-containing protein, partial [Ignavibacteriaceae bacterium]|nr:glycoside hydrolase family 3 N-terminal domain-containing protein [Ignavibacteriaceae bacterium]